MKVFHASTVVVDTPDTLHSRRCLDFGKGFYVTTLEMQANNYAQRFILRSGSAVINEYELHEHRLVDFSVKQFIAYDEDWLDFVLSCRRDEDHSDWDVVIGGVANDKVFRTVDLFFSGDMPKSEALKRLRYEKPNDQICIRNQKAIDALLSFMCSKEVS